MTTRILVVDDEPRYVRLMEVNLLTEGYQVIKAYDGQKAVEIVADKQPDLVLLEGMSPGLNGFAACERIREFSNVPIIMVTAKGEEQDRVRGLDVGADDYIVKPFSATELLARLRQKSSKTRKWSSFLPPNIAFCCNSCTTWVISSLPKTCWSMFGGQNTGR